MESLPHGNKYKWVNCRHLSGTDCYCDEDGKKALQEIISHYPVNGIHFIDSGNYHYVTKFWTDRIDKPFVLIVFDHHPDMQPSLFENILSCGSWVKDILDSNANCRKVIIVGASDMTNSSVLFLMAMKAKFISIVTMISIMKKAGKTFPKNTFQIQYTSPLTRMYCLLNMQSQTGTKAQ